MTKTTAFKEATRMVLVLEMLDSKKAFMQRHKWNLSEPVREIKFIDLVNGIERKVGRFRNCGEDNRAQSKHLEIYCTKHRTLVNNEREWHDLVTAYTSTPSSSFVVYIHIEPTSRLVVDEDRDTVMCVSDEEEEELQKPPEKQYSFLQQLVLDLVDKDQALVEQMLLEHSESVLVHAEHLYFSRNHEAFSKEFVEKLRQSVPMADFDLVVVDEVPVGADVALQVETQDVVWAELAEEEAQLQVRITGPDFVFVAHESDLDWFAITVTNMSVHGLHLPEGAELRDEDDEDKKLVALPVPALAAGESHEVKVKYELCNAHVRRTLKFNLPELSYATFTYEVYVEQEDEAFARKEKDAALAQQLVEQDEQASLAEEQRNAALAQQLHEQDRQAQLQEERNAAMAQQLVEQERLGEERNATLARQLAEQERLEEERNAALAQQLAEQEEQYNVALARQLAEQERLEEERNAALAQQEAECNAALAQQEEERNAALAQQLEDEHYAELAQQEEEERNASAVLAETLQREEDELEARARLDADLAVCVDQEECNGAMMMTESNNNVDDDEALARLLQNEEQLVWDIAEALHGSLHEERSASTN